MPSSDLPYTDRLALERTLLAAERTLLAYARTALGFLAAGAVLLRLPSSTPPDRWLGIGCVGAGALVAVVGAARFVAQRRTLARLR